jgi:hypothetical protein
MIKEKEIKHLNVSKLDDEGNMEIMLRFKHGRTKFQCYLPWYLWKVFRHKIASLEAEDE